MKRIPLHAKDGSVAAYAVVDDADHEALARHSWSLNQYGYARRTVHSPRSKGKRRGTTILMSRQILGFPPGQVDHRDLDRLNNQRHNLRVSTHAQNQHNRGMQRNNTSGYRGVTMHKSGRWAAKVKLAGKSRYLGLFATAAEAGEVAAAYRRQHMPFSEADR